MFFRLAFAIAITLFYSGNVTAEKCTIVFGGAGKTVTYSENVEIHPALPDGNYNSKRIMDIGGPWDFIRGTSGKGCSFIVYNDIFKNGIN